MKRIKHLWLVLAILAPAVTRGCTGQMKPGHDGQRPAETTLAS